MRALMQSQVAFVDPMVGGLPVDAWLDMHGGCTEVDGFGALRLRAWPDGRSFLKQPAVTTEMFALMDAETARQIAESSSRAK